MSRLALIVASLAVGVVLAVGAAFTTSGVITAPPSPPNKQLYNYGQPSSYPGPAGPRVSWGENVIFVRPDGYDAEAASQ